MGTNAARRSLGHGGRKWQTAPSAVGEGVTKAPLALDATAQGIVSDIEFGSTTSLGKQFGGYGCDAGEQRR